MILNSQKGIFASVRSGAQEILISVCPSVPPYDSSLSRALNLHLSGSGLSKVSLRYLTGLFQVHNGSLSGLSFYVALPLSSLSLLRRTDKA